MTTAEIATVHRRYPVAAEEDVGALRRAVRALAARTPGLSEGDPELVATELATNLLRHALPGGYVLVRGIGAGPEGGIELIAVDRGPGLPETALETLAAGGVLAPSPSLSPTRRGGLGVGLAAVQRRARVFDYYSSRGGTVILVRLQPRAAAAVGPWVWGGVDVPFGGEGPSGDGWAVSADGRAAAFAVDGLGHGPEAATAAQAALGAFDHWRSAGAAGRERLEDDLGELIRRVHRAMRTTRGGVVGACVIDPGAERLVFGGIGNIHGRVLIGPQRHHLLSQPGTLGTQLAEPRIRTTVHPWPAGSALVLASDGIDTRWNPAAHPGLLRRHPAVAAAVIHRDHARNSDDAAVLVMRDNRGAGQAGGGGGP